MKTLVNKNNPAIRITAPEIETGTHGYYYVNSVGYRKDQWTLVEEEPVDFDLVKKIISTYKSIVHREEEAAIDWYMDDDNTGISYKEMTPEEIYKEVCKLIKK